MKFILLLAVLYLVHAEETKNDQQQSFRVVLVDSKSSESDNSDQKQSKRSLFEGSSFGASGGGIGLAFPAEPIAASGPGLYAGPESGSGLFAGSAPGPGIFAGPAPVAAIAAPGPAPGLYTEANIADPAAYGSGYAPTFASLSAPSGPHIHYSPTGPHVHLGEQLVSQRIEITRPVPVPVYKTVAVAVPHPVPYPVPHPVAVKVPHPVPVEVPVAYPVVKHVPYAVEKPVPFPVDKPYPVKIIKKVPVPIPKPYPVHIPILIKKHIHHHDSHFSKGWD